MDVCLKLQGDRSLPIRNTNDSSSFSVNAPFDGESTNHADFQRKEAEKSKLSRPHSSSNLLSPSASKFDATTTTRADFIQKPHVRVINVKPRDDSFSGHVSRFDADTTYHDGFQEKSETTQHSDFIEKHVDICPAEKVLTRRDRSFEFKRTANGHRYYEQRVTHGTIQPNRLVPVEA
uniref:Uncharacterized protein n=1 Tax=Caenorhabditis tropicalis TaxID=1561998 RepID=A0A1I7UYC1_9PELO